ncbi:diguanylate cyclase [Arenimonas terrae]|nr:diguanylate cyclase [Arenimonas terrae]
MSDESPASAVAAPPRETRAVRLRSLPRRTYRFRVLGMGLAALPLIAVMRELDSPWPVWAWMGLGCFLWPHLAYLLARRSADPFRAELRNFVLDSFFAGSWVPLMHFNLMPSVVLLAVVSADKINSGIRGLWLRSLPGMLLAIVAGGLLTGFAFAPVTSLTVMMASLPILVIHTLAVSLSSYQLVRRVQQQNLLLEALNQRDALTGLDSRSHWEEQSLALLQRHQASGEPATLMLIDADRFKGINDRYGHGAGDDVLRAIADLLRRELQGVGHAGRLGGDEFVVALPAGLAQARDVAERLRGAVAALQFARTPGLQGSVSIGLAPAPAAPLGLREWLEAADRALYRAKHDGRNRTAGSDALPPLDA